ncbi:MAG: hypothetical protein WD844_06385 [Thermoleophilaceae bacterium]
MLRLPIVLAALIALLGLAACGGDDNGETTSRADAAATPDVGRYCQLVKELDARGEEHFASLGEDASAEDFEAAERGFVERYEAELDELQRVAPTEIKADAEKLLAAMRQRAGLTTTTEVDEAEAAAAEERIQVFEKRECD